MLKEQEKGIMQSILIEKEPIKDKVVEECLGGGRLVRESASG